MCASAGSYTTVYRYCLLPVSTGCSTNAYSKDLQTVTKLYLDMLLLLCHGIQPLDLETVPSLESLLHTQLLAYTD